MAEKNGETPLRMQVQFHELERAQAELDDFFNGIAVGETISPCTRTARDCRTISHDTVARTVKAADSQYDSFTSSTSPSHKRSSLGIESGTDWVANSVISPLPEPEQKQKEKEKEKEKEKTQPYDTLQPSPHLFITVTRVTGDVRKPGMIQVPWPVALGLLIGMMALVTRLLLQ